MLDKGVTVCARRFPGFRVVFINNSDPFADPGVTAVSLCRSGTRKRTSAPRFTAPCPVRGILGYSTRIWGNHNGVINIYCIKCIKFGLHTPS
jgi:hypothetical protein